ncbi:hypothetical protein SDC9_105443 [bioreactor metagenome]|uniref:Uncharacterized protein n=1 Tax=bioreactor metagenome TaxID=1076179 RepID=A0A645B215_9ZZZZ
MGKHARGAAQHPFPLIGGNSAVHNIAAQNTEGKSGIVLRRSLQQAFPLAVLSRAGLHISHIQEGERRLLTLRRLEMADFAFRRFVSNPVIIGRAGSQAGKRRLLHRRAQRNTAGQFDVNGGNFFCARQGRARPIFHPAVRRVRFRLPGDGHGCFRVTRPGENDALRSRALRRPGCSAQKAEQQQHQHPLCPSSHRPFSLHIIFNEMRVGAGSGALRFNIV